MSSPARSRCGTVVLAGRPNAGKSTLLNRLIGADLAITSDKPQSTRQAVVGIRTDEDVQLIFVDPPGLLDPRHLLHETMLAEATTTLSSADAILHVHPAPAGLPPALTSLVSAAVRWECPVATVFTFVDKVAPEERPLATASAFPVDGVTGEGVSEVLTWCRAHVPEGTFRFGADDLSTQPMRFFAAEYVREAALGVLRQEIPHGIAVAVDEFREDLTGTYIRATIFVERPSQKGMVIGASGRTIKAIGAAARRRIEALLGGRVYLDLWVKVLPRWRRSAELLRRLGFNPPSASAS